ncbi:ATP-grasp domain-containing protein [Stappia sp.]|uniref:ATP-grasp domain-containing protein n=1 Tax=Stappia sp. TaxID=1870903 RepID=UPI003C79D352
MRILFVGARPLNGLAPLVRLARQGHEIDLASSDLTLPMRFDPENAAAFHSIVRHLQIPAGSNATNVSAAIEGQGRHLARYAAILTLNDSDAELAAELAKLGGQRHATPQAIKLAKDKAGTRERLTRDGLPQPRFEVVYTLEMAWRAASRIGYPLMVKPRKLSASRGIRCVSADGELAAAYDHARRAVQHHHIHDHRGLLLEEYIDGPIVSAEVMANAGRYLILGFTDRTIPGSGYVEQGGTFPARVPPEATRTVCDALSSIGFLDGAAHVELCLSARGPLVIEINPRLAGFLVPEAIEAATGLDPYHALVDLHANNGLPELPRRHRYSAIRAKTAPKTGTLANLDAAHARTMPGVSLVQLFRRPGDRLRPAENNRDRVAGVIAVADDPDSAHRIAELACNAIFIEYE